MNYSNYLNLKEDHMPSDRDREQLIEILERRVIVPNQRKRHTGIGFFYHCQQGSTLAIAGDLSELLDTASHADLVLWGDGSYCFGIGLRLQTPDGPSPWIKTYYAPQKDSLCLHFSQAPAEHLLPPRSLHIRVVSIGDDGFETVSRSAVFDYPFWARLNHRVHRSRSMQYRPMALRPQIAELQRATDATLDSAFGDRTRIELH
jgi:hypothetical protein